MGTSKPWGVQGSTINLQDAVHLRRMPRALMKEEEEEEEEELYRKFCKLP